VLEKIRQRALAEIPGLRVAKDQFSRMFDLALEFAEEEPVLPLSDAVNTGSGGTGRGPSQNLFHPR